MSAAKAAAFPMRSNFNYKERAIEYLKQAVQEDNAGNYVKAFPLYMNAIEYFRTDIRYEKNPNIREAIAAKITEYLRRAEEIHAVLDEGGAWPRTNGGDAAVATRPETKGKDILEQADEDVESNGTPGAVDGQEGRGGIQEDRAQQA